MAICHGENHFRFRVCRGRKAVDTAWSNGDHATRESGTHPEQAQNKQRYGICHGRSADLEEDKFQQRPFENKGDSPAASNWGEATKEETK